MQETWVWSLGWEDLVEEGKAVHSRFLFFFFFSLQISCLENPMDRGACWATVHKVAKSQTWRSNWTELNWISISNQHGSQIYTMLHMKCISILKGFNEVHKFMHQWPSFLFLWWDSSGRFFMQCHGCEAPDPPPSAITFPIAQFEGFFLLSCPFLHLSSLGLTSK